MNHPTETDLALYAGNDLARLARLRVDWHLRTCGKCQQEVTEFSSLRAETARNAAEPDVNWDRLAAEMKANIRLGLQAGECIGPVRTREPIRANWSWPILATAALLAIAVGGELWIHQSFPLPKRGPAQAAVSPSRGVILEVEENGIRMSNGGNITSEFRKPADTPVVYSVNAQGGVGASYVDPESGIVTVNNF